MANFLVRRTFIVQGLPANHLVEDLSLCHIAFTTSIFGWEARTQFRLKTTPKKERNNKTTTARTVAHSNCHRKTLLSPQSSRFYHISQSAQINHDQSDTFSKCTVSPFRGHECDFTPRDLSSIAFSRFSVRISV